MSLFPQKQPWLNWLYQAARQLQIIYICSRMAHDLDDEIAAGKEVGIRLHASRGSMSLGESKGGLPPDSVVDTEENILRDSQRLIETYHDPKPGSMLQIVLAPCSPFSVTGDLDA